MPKCIVVSITKGECGKEYIVSLLSQTVCSVGLLEVCKFNLIQAESDLILFEFTDKISDQIRNFVQTLRSDLERYAQLFKCI